MQLYNIVPAYSWPDFTHVGVHLKKLIEAYYHMDMEDHQARWCSPPSAGGLKRFERRILMAQWTAAAWLTVSEKQEFLRQASLSSGFLLAKGGSENGFADSQTRALNTC
jgi:hypothetical protein